MSAESDAIDQVKQAINELSEVLYNKDPISAQALLDLLLTVDGDGSGLDADLLRGYEPSDGTDPGKIMTRISTLWLAGDNNINFKPGASQQRGLTYWDNTAANRLFLWVNESQQVVILGNRRADGDVEIRASGPSGGAQERTTLTATYDELFLHDRAHIIKSGVGGVIHETTTLAAGSTNYIIDNMGGIGPDVEHVLLRILASTLGTGTQSGWVDVDGHRGDAGKDILTLGSSSGDVTLYLKWVSDVPYLQVSGPRDLRVSYTLWYNREI